MISHEAIWAIFAALLGAGAACAQDFPNKPIRLIVGFPPGGGADTVARLIVPKLSEHLGQQLVIDNRAGASGNIALEQLAKAPPDGYALMVTTPTVTVNPALMQDLVTIQSMISRRLH